MLSAITEFHGIETLGTTSESRHPKHPASTSVDDNPYHSVVFTLFDYGHALIIIKFASQTCHLLSIPSY